MYNIRTARCASWDPGSRKSRPRVHHERERYRSLYGKAKKTKQGKHPTSSYFVCDRLWIGECCGLVAIPSALVCSRQGNARNWYRPLTRSTSDCWLEFVSRSSHKSIQWPWPVRRSQRFLETLATVGLLLSRTSSLENAKEKGPYCPAKSVGHWLSRTWCRGFTQQHGKVSRTKKVLETDHNQDRTL